MTRILAIGDIHGCSGAFDTLLAAVKPLPDDVIVTLGDYVDRGPDSFGVIERLLALNKSHHLIALRGNHEWMMLESRRVPASSGMWLSCGGWQTLASYGTQGEFGTLEDVSEAHWEFMEQVCRLWYETETHFFVHAMADPSLPLAEQKETRLYWQPLVDPRPHISGKVMICGHTAQESGLPLNLGHTVCIDTFAHGNGWLTCLEVGSGMVWQTNEQGKLRKARLDDSATGGMEFTWTS